MSCSTAVLDLYLAHRGALVDYASVILNCRARAEDVVQDAWLRLSNQQPSEAPIQQPLSYLYRVVRNLALDLNRHLRVHNSALQPLEELAELASPAPTPEHSSHYQQQLDCLEQALQRLPLRSRQVFYLHRVQGLTFKQIANQLAISSSLAHQLLREALTFCAEQLGDD